MKRVRVFLARLAACVHPARADRDLDDELASHLAEAIDEYIARGFSPGDARLAALRGFGGVLQTKERYRRDRSFGWLDDLRSDIRHTARALVKNPGFTLIAVFTLALGIGANTAIFTLLDAVVFKPLPIPAVGELVTLYENGPEGAADATGGGGRYLRFSYPRFERLQTALGEHGSLAAVTRSNRFSFRLPGAAGTRFLQAQLVSDRYFSTLGITAARGRLLAPGDVRAGQVSPAAVISDRFARRMFGGAEGALGQSVIVNGVTVTVVGVTPAHFAGIWTDKDAEMWLPLTLQPALRYNNNSSGYGRIDTDGSWVTQDIVAWLNIVGRVPRKEQPQAIRLLQAANHDGLVALASVFENPKARTSMLAHTLAVEPLSRGFSALRARFSDALFALTAMVALVLLVTCANIANLLLTRAAGRARDVGIRLSLGATTGRLVRQCLTESLMLAIGGGAAGFALGGWASGFLAREVIGTSGQLPLIFSPDVRVLVFTIAVSCVTAVAFGLAPAFRAIRIGRTAALGTNQRHAVGQPTTGGMRSLVVGQLALSVVVVGAAILLGRTLVNFMRIDPGFATDRLVTVSLDPIDSGYTADQMPALARRLVAAVATLPGVTSAAVSRCGLVAGCASSGSFHVEGGEDGSTFYANWVTPAYFSTAGVPLVSGREFTEHDTEHGPRVAVVNESSARLYFHGQNPIGRRLGVSEPDVEIVGVVRDAHTQSLHDAPVPMAYFPLDQKPSQLQTAPTNMDVRVSGDAAALVSSVRQAIRRTEPDLLLDDVTTMSARLARDLSRERVVAYLAFSFGVLTLVLASLGLYGVLSYAVAQRTQEFGVRMALGAQRAEVMRLVLGQSVKLTAAGLILGLAGAAACARYLSGMLYGVSPLDGVTLLTVALAFTVVATFASYVPAHRAIHVDPLAALRSE